MRAVSRQAGDDALRSPAERQMTIMIHGNRRLREAAGTDLKVSQVSPNEMDQMYGRTSTSVTS
jgi:hypothetical protein